MANDIIGPLIVSPQDTVAQSRVQDLGDKVKRGELTKASQDFEAYFLSYLLKVMRETVPKGGLLDTKRGDVFHSFYDEELGRRASEAGGIGLARLILASLEDPPSSQGERRATV